MTSQTLASDSNDTVATKGYVDAKGGGPVNFSCPAGQFVAGFGPTGAPLCRGPSYLYQWEVSAYGACSVTCGGGTQTRTIKCRRNDGYYMTDESYCNEAKPSTTNSCNTQVCLV